MADMPETMIDRMARCLCLLAGGDPDDAEQMSHHARDARQLAQAMVKPSDGMSARCGPAADAWPDLIDAILEEGLEAPALTQAACP